MLYNIHYDVSAICIFAFILFSIYTRKGFSKRSNQVFFALVLGGLISAITDIISSYYISYPERISHVGLDFWNYTFLSVHNAMAFMVVAYVITLLGLQARMKVIHWVVVAAPIAVAMCALFTNPLTGVMFYYDETGLYTHGPLFIIMYVTAFLNLAIAVALIIRFHKALPVEKIVALIAVVALCIVPISIQMQHQYLLIEIFFQAIGLMGLLFSIENEDEIKNPITGALNRYAFLRDMDMAIHAGTPQLALMVKIYNFNYANSTLGVQYMNHVQKEMSSWLQAQAKKADCYDFYGGHFVLVQRGSDKERMAGIVERIRERFDLEWAYGALSVVFPAQICLLEIPREVPTLEQLLLIIDVPVEENHSRSHVIPSDALYSYQREVQIEQKIQEALENQSFQVYYQPILDVKSGQIRCAEALVRLFDDELGFIPPDEFIPIAERNGRIMEIGTFVVEEACRVFAENRLAEKGIDYIEVNLSVVQCMNHHLPRIVQDILTRRGLKPSQINLEITESAAAGNKASLEKTVRELAGRGFTLSLDDYGTGYSNYSYMFALPFKIIKIDKSILWSALDEQDRPGETSAMILLQNTVRMLKQMEYRVVAEGVETARQRQLLEELGCDYLQGYLFSKPLSQEEFLAFITDHSAVA